MLLKLVICFFVIYTAEIAARHIDESPQLEGLYNATDSVFVLNNEDHFTESVFNQNHATFVEFYNSFCGFCRRYAPTWKTFASDVVAWQNVVHVAAVNCAADENSNLCRKYEIMAYPSLRYFPPLFNDPNNWGTPVQSHPEAETLRSTLVEMLRNESAVLPNWPQLTPFQHTHKRKLFDGLANQVNYVFLLFASGNTTDPNQVALEFSANPHICVKWINTTDVASGFSMSHEHFLSVVHRNLDVIPVSVLSADHSTVVHAIRAFLEERNLTATSTTETSRKYASSKMPFNIAVFKTDRVYLTDLQHAVFYSLFHEVPQFSIITDERLKALKLYTNIIKRYLPFGETGHEFLSNLAEMTTGTTELEGNYFKTHIQHSLTKYNINITTNWMGCQGSSTNLRGYSCGLWELFHFLTVQSAADTTTTDPLDALKAVHGFVKHFFGCSDCSQHFQAMADEMNIWQVPTKDEAVLWLWKAHNQVNRRLAGDITEDPAHKKVQFPTPFLCAQCRDQSADWQLPNVLQFLSQFYSVANVSRFDDNDWKSARAEKRILDNVFSEMDMRMGIMLYVFCIAMMAVAVKLLVRRGYRKKLYSHDYKV